MGDVIPVGEAAEDVLGQTYHDQMLKQYWQAGEQLALNALVMLCLTAKRFDKRVKFILLENSDQGEWQYVAGLMSGVPTYAGEFSEVLDVDPEQEFEDGGWASSIDDRTEHVWLPFMDTSEHLPQWRLLNVDLVLTEVHLPWRPVTQVTEAVMPTHLTASDLGGV